MYISLEAKHVLGKREKSVGYMLVWCDNENERLYYSSWTRTVPVITFYDNFQK